MFYFNVTQKQCLAFIYGGCDGNENRFETLYECEAKCGVKSDELPYRMSENKFADVVRTAGRKVKRPNRFRRLPREEVMLLCVFKLQEYL